jgi:flagellar hook assembly protein FlgD
LFATVGLPTGLDGIPEFQTNLINCYPNPFSNELTISIKLTEKANVQVEVLNQLGQRVKMVATKQLMPGGLHKLAWNGRNSGNGEAASGIYYVRIEIDDSIIQRKIVLSK